MLHRDFGALDDAHLSFSPDNFTTHARAPDADSITVPDAHLLFTAEFTRSGPYDLKLTGEDGQSFVVRDYFKTDQHPTLRAPNGAILTPDTIDALAGPLNPGQYAQAAAPQSAATAIGHVTTVSGNVTVVRNGVSIALNNGDAVLKGDVVQTGSDGAVGLVFADGSAFNLTAGARMMLNEFVYDPNGAGNSEIVNLIQGSLTFISGQVAASGGNMQIKTPAATMGIRGTSGQSALNLQDGEATFSVYSEDGFHSADIFDNAGNLIARATSDGGIIRVRGGSASETSKTVEQKLIELTALNAIQQTKGFVNQYFQNLPDSKTNPDDHTNANPNPNSTGSAGTSIFPSEGIKLTLTDIGKTAGGATTFSAHITSSDGTPLLPDITIPISQNPKPVFVNAQTITQIVNGQTITQISAGDQTDSFGPRLSNDSGTSTPPWLAGRYVVFIGAEALPGQNDDNVKSDIFVYDRLTQTLKSMTVGHLVPHDGETFHSLPSISADGHWAVFSGHYQTTETSLDQNNQPFTWTQDHNEVFLYDTWTDTTKLLVASSGGEPQISANGNFVLIQTGTGFYDPATNTNHTQQDIVVTDLNGNALDDLYVDIVGPSGPIQNGIGAGSISADGSYLTFWSTASQLHYGNTVFQLDSSGVAQVYLYDRTNHTVTEITKGGNGNSGALNPANDSTDDWSSGVSANGRYVVFQSDASNLVANDVNGHSDIFVYDTLNKTTQLVSKDLTNVAANFGDSIRPEISPDGRYVTFVSSASDLVAGDTNNQPDAFLYDRLTGKTTLLSSGPNGPSDGDSEWGTTLTTAAIFLAFGSTATNLATTGANAAAVQDDPTSSIYLVDRSFLNTVTLVDNGVSPSILSQTGELSFTDVNDLHTVSFAYVNDVNTPVWSTFSTASVPAIDTLLGVTEGVIDYSVQVNEAYAASLLPGQTHTDIVAVTITDGAGGQAVTNVYVTIAGNDILQVAPQSETRGDHDAPAPPINLLAGVSSNHSDTFQVTGFKGSAFLIDAQHPNGVQIDVGSQIDAGGILFEHNGQVVTQSDYFDTLIIDPTKFNFLTEGQSLKLLADYGVWDGYTTAHDTATFIIVGHDDAPVVTGSIVLTAIDENSGPRLITQAELLANATDVDGPSLTAVGLTIAVGGGVLADNHDGTWTYTPAPHDSTSVKFSYDITDGVAAPVGDSATLDIIAVNDAPVVTGSVTLTSILEDSGPRTITQAQLLANVTDIDGPQLTATGLAISSGNGVLTDNHNGTWTYRPGLNDDTSVAFSYQVTDGIAPPVSDQASLDIIGVNDSPIIIAPSHLEYWTTSFGGNVTAIDQIKFADADAGNDAITVTFSVGNGGGKFTAPDLANDGVAIVLSGHGSSSPADTVTLTGSISDINAYVSGDNILYDPPGTSDRSMTVSINDNSHNGPGVPLPPLTATTTVILDSVSPSFGSGSDNLDLHDVNMFGTRTLHLGDGGSGNVLVTSWNHLDGVTTYDGDDTGGNDTVTLVFAPSQLEQILTTTSYRNELHSYLDGDPGTGSSADTLNLAGSNWNAIVSGFEVAKVALAAGSDYVTYDAIGDTLPDFRSNQVGTGGNDTLVASAAHPDLSGGEGNDILVAASSGSVLQGEAGADLLLGNSGADTLQGGVGNDIEWGGAGADTFKFNETVSGAANFGHDTILDFATGQDTVQFSAAIFATTADVLAHTTQVGYDLVITAGTSDVTLKNVTLATLHANDFHIV